MDRWQPIVTAPKDGTVILAWLPVEHWQWPNGMVLICWDTADKVWAISPACDPDYEYMERINQPTHWQSLPEPPEDK